MFMVFQDKKFDLEKLQIIPHKKKCNIMKNITKKFYLWF